MTKAQLISAIKAVHDSVSGNAALTSDQARAEISDGIGTAVDTFVASKIPADESQRINALKDLVSELVKELLKQRIDIGRNLDLDKLNTIVDGLDNM